MIKTCGNCRYWECNVVDDVPENDYGICWHHSDAAPLSNSYRFDTCELFEPDVPGEGPVR